MENLIGNHVKQYQDSIIVSSIINDDTIIGSDVFVSNCKIGMKCKIERRGMLFDSVIEDYSYTGYNTVIKHTKMGKFCSVSWNVSIGGANHDYRKITTHPFIMNPRFGYVSETGEYDSFKVPLVIGNDVWIGSGVNILRGGVLQ